MSTLEIIVFCGSWGVFVAGLWLMPVEKLLNEQPKKHQVVSETGTLKTITTPTEPIVSPPEFLEDQNLTL